MCDLGLSYVQTQFKSVVFLHFCCKTLLCNKLQVIEGPFLSLFLFLSYLDIVVSTSRN